MRRVRQKSLARLRDAIRAKTRRTSGISLSATVKALNPVLKGWFGYFRHAIASTFPDVDGFVRRRLRAILRKQAKIPGFGKSIEDSRRWPNAFFTNAGLFTMTTALKQIALPR